MNNGIPQKYQGMMRDLLQNLRGTGKRIELITEKGAYTMQANKSLKNPRLRSSLVRAEPGG
ncbi:hypothetical protein [Paenibacillus woosongensis]|uniref:Uncharacterized protein n=1 Tax=Paenibacillus woosongensis TaxID=307580 RepID=A0ABQ4MUG7_9BACL|nr:hypothetical protein [Paenibacillus woosongensis]GIP59566.1 hypothetical protein J15TS10_33800 [Paenibacillus woosongensis]